jgi:hypothetical protein
MTKRFLFVILFVFGTFLSTFAQREALKNDLGKSFKNADVVRINVRHAKAGQKLSIAAANKNFELSLTPRDLRSPRYFAEETTSVGTRRLEKTPATTYKGRITGDAESEVRLTIDDSGIEGFFGSKQERYFIEPAGKYSASATADEFVVYQESDVLRDKSINCPQDLTREIEGGKSLVQTEGVENLTGLKTIEIATEADFDFVGTTNNDANAANAKILSILNMVEGIYESELNLTLSVVFQHAWSTPDPFNGSSADVLLRSFQTHWNTNYPATQYPRDTAHLFTYKPNVRAQGYAFFGVMCSNSAFAYGLSGRVDPSWGWEEANFLVTAHEIGHNLGANHSDTMANCTNSLMQAQLNGSSQLSFCTASRTEVSNFVSSNGTCLTARNFGRLDFDGDGKTDIGIFRPSAGEWWVNRSSTSQTVAAQFGLSSDKVVSGDYTGDGKTDIAFWRPSNGNWFVLRSDDGSFFSFPFGATGDVPVPSDFDGDSKTDAAVFRPSTGTWYIQRSSGGTIIGQFGQAGDVPVTADYDGDGKSDIAIYRPAAGEWWIQRSSNSSVYAFQFGTLTDKPVQGDYTGDGKADVAFFRPADGNWFILRSEDSSFYSVPFGTTGDVAVPGDYDGDGKFDTAVFRPSVNSWFIQRTSAGTAIVNFGASGDNPIPNAFVP